MKTIHPKNKQFQDSLNNQPGSDFLTLGRATERINELRIAILTTSPEQTLKLIENEIQIIESEAATMEEKVAKEWLLKFVGTLQHLTSVLHDGRGNDFKEHRTALLTLIGEVTGGAK